MKRLYLSCLIILLYASCKITYQKEISTFLDKYYEKIEHKNFDSALLFYSESFFDSSTTKEKWKNELQKIQVNFGGFKSYNVIKYSEEHSLQVNTIDIELQVLYDSITFKENIRIVPENKSFFIKTHYIERVDF